MTFYSYTHRPHPNTPPSSSHSWGLTPQMLSFIWPPFTYYALLLSYFPSLKLIIWQFTSLFVPWGCPTLAFYRNLYSVSPSTPFFIIIIQLISRLRNCPIRLHTYTVAALMKVCNWAKMVFQSYSQNKKIIIVYLGNYVNRTITIPCSVHAAAVSPFHCRQTISLHETVSLKAWSLSHFLFWNTYAAPGHPVCCENSMTAGTSTYFHSLINRY